MGKGIGGHSKAYSGKTNEWLTPPYILKSLGEFDLDPCAPVERPWNTAKQYLTIMDDGLSKNWHGRVWLNPPYGQHTGSWLSKLSDHGNGIALIFARTETKMFFDFVWGKANAVLFLRGRLYFHHLDGSKAKHNSGAPSVLIAYGDNNAQCLSNCSIDGFYVNLR